jgi:PAS domain S-box-containing protein
MLQQPDAPPVAILDVNMPGMDGIEVCQRIRQSSQAWPTYLILLTANSSKSDVVAGLESGADDYVIKPFDGEELCARVQAGVRIVELQRRLAEQVKELGETSAELQHNSTALRLSEQKYRSLIANIPDVTWTSDLQGRISFISPNVERIYGFKAEEIFQDPISLWQGRIHSDDRQRVKEGYDSLFTGSASYDVNYRIQRKDEEWVWLHDRAFASYERDGVMYADGVFSDITERKRVEEALRQSEEHLRRAQKLESIGQLAAGIAHEINTPMQYLGDNIRFLQDSFGDLARVLKTFTPLLAACQKAESSSELAAEMAAAVEVADMEYLNEQIPAALQQSLEGVERVSKIVESMKDFAHPCLEKKPANLNRAIESTITVARNEWKYVADLVTDFDPHLPLVPCLIGEFNQVVLNLIINAAHAISDVVGDGDKGKGNITISTRQTTEWAEVRIADTGGGIPEKIRARIFDPFFTTKDVGRGTGQGLAISHAVVVERHGGAIEFETEMGHGTTFIIRLPIQGVADPLALTMEI